MSENNITAAAAMEKLKEGNLIYRKSGKSIVDTDHKLREDTCKNGQKPFAVIITCSDSRVIPESIFSAAIGDLFVIRVAGNVMDKHQLGSVEYAADHLGVNLVVVLGHTHCGAVGAAINDEPQGFVKTITDEIRKAIGNEQDEYKACCLNVKNSVRIIEKNLKKYIEENENPLKVTGAVYHLEDGRVEFDI